MKQEQISSWLCFLMLYCTNSIDSVAMSISKYVEQTGCGHGLK